MSKKSHGVIVNAQDAKTLNKLAREQLKLKILADVLTDMSICRIEGWDQTEYIHDLINMLNSLLKSGPKIQPSILCDNCKKPC